MKLIKADGYEFKDLNKNGELDPYEDWRRSAQERAEDLAARMSVEQIVGLMLYSSHQSIPVASGGFGGGIYNGQPLNKSDADPSDVTDQQEQFITEDNLRHVSINN